MGSPTNCPDGGSLDSLGIAATRIWLGEMLRHQAQGRPSSDFEMLADVAFSIFCSIKMFQILFCLVRSRGFSGRSVSSRSPNPAIHPSLQVIAFKMLGCDRNRWPSRAESSFVNTADQLQNHITTFNPRSMASGSGVTCSGKLQFPELTVLGRPWVCGLLAVRSGRSPFVAACIRRNLDKTTRS